MPQLSALGTPNQGFFSQFGLYLRRCWHLASVFTSLLALGVCVDRLVRASADDTDTSNYGRPQRRREDFDEDGRGRRLR